ncbi:glycerophosphoryl diester phosphodiesterase, putative [Entamoeba histolytica HM-1:IMSS-B]|uniref:Glycerophosphoryl diester phosphodiesterase, putative n=6 Tax=Entamoeba histolytica TaxID=5759 RepID=C4M708_ENTH1|nr:glycerophosphoryl diester phosphodiesterase, putative [Entamoeba histolytica HM-1:IMSS]EMD44523.1 glycerophosphoryl diester phosphodiesterase, putative [Entamoeba histolytica KU27]EMH72020.1 glycerophosphoryl diester phosphodiesterase, putative [Entamoeba histolytica HM-1:IMSS-B]EMS17715.1 glycerophosphoryl diester phosphodiesterase [Entamoeba histolytica HM-3:IMSS]ENY63791.1 glycerophosphoryl diester phosphodiesterase, putative [Entamoeba histolytica HM-1:IMSS-A]GAT97295.1 glycerophosphory|eukprot:XP_652342.1 glycerophosphoryl diester phosphodiesterase, putative [Entamoeba histolytica HM-1:IMSS]
MSDWSPCLLKGWELRLWFGDVTESGYSNIQLDNTKEPFEIEVLSEKGCVNNERNHIQVRANEKTDFNLEIKLLTTKEKVLIGSVVFITEEFVNYGHLFRPIVFEGKKVGKLEVGYILFNAFKNEIDKPIHIDLKNKIIGHRGFGATNRNIIKNSVVIENTLNAFFTSSRHHTDFVEFDVQLTLDKIPIIHHDFWLQLKTTDFLGHPQVIRVPVNKLTYEQIRKLQPIVLDHNYYENFLKSHKISLHTSTTHPISVDDSTFVDRLKKQDELELAVAQLLQVDPNSSIYEFKEFDEEGMIKSEKSSRKVSEFQSNFPTLAELLQMIPEEIGFDIEIKYWNCPEEGRILGYMERNEYLNRILQDIFTYGKNRKIFFSSFDPDTVVLLNKKQMKYPILFLTEGMFDNRIVDTRRHSLINAINFALRHQIMGIVCNAKAVLKEPQLVEFAHEKGLIVITYGDENDDLEIAKKEYSIGVDSLCTNRVVDVGLQITKTKLN